MSSRNRVKRGIQSLDYRSRRDKDVSLSRKEFRRQTMEEYRQEVDKKIEEQFLDVIQEETIDLLNRINENSSETEFDVDLLKELKELIRRSSPHPHKLIIESGIVQNFINFCIEKSTEISEEIYLIVWILNNLCGGSSYITQFCMSHGIIDMLMRLLIENEEPKIKWQAIWCLGNIMSHDIQSRDRVLVYKPLSHVCQFIENLNEVMTELDYDEESNDAALKDLTQMIETSIWTIYTVFLHTPYPLNQLSIISETLLTMTSAEEVSILKVTLKCLRNIFRANELVHSDNIDSILPADMIVESVFSLLEENFFSNNTDLISSCLAVLGNMAHYREFNEIFYEHTPLDIFKSLILEGTVKCQYGCTWVLSNYCLFSSKHVEAFIESGIANDIIQLLSCEVSDIRTESIWCICNAMYSSSNEQIHWFVENGVISPLVSLLSVQNSQIILLIVEAFKRILETSPDYEDSGEKLYKLFILKCNGYEYLINLLEHSDKAVRQSIESLLTEFFVESEDLDGISVDPDLDVVEEDEWDENIDEDETFDTSSGLFT
eukprot:TRINITY_DN2733_c0_g1_i1.p1 TRINITY_DN2733_c0_g1~~TRINITY_DN2733_c0_g1_i1.p1  ORF type:complete len:547 (+),score=100.63 TRINITY_DN2733_c0_g1_i1:54-1694(+)